MIQYDGKIPPVGTKILIEKAGPGCYGADGKIGYITNKVNTHGLFNSDPGFNVQTEKAIWRIHFDSKFRILNLKHIRLVPDIEKVIFNYPATIILWEDKTKTIVKCQENESFDFEKGIALCIAKKALGNKSSYYDIFRKHIL